MCAKGVEAGVGTGLVADLSVDAREGRIGRRVDEIAVEEAGLEALFIHEPGKDIVVDILIEYATFKPSAPRCFAQGDLHCLCGLDGIRIFLEASGTFDEQTGSAPVCTPVTNAPLVSLLLLEQKPHFPS